MPELQNIYTIRLNEKLLDGIIKDIGVLMQKHRNGVTPEYQDFDHLAVLRDILRAAEPEKFNKEGN
jgi:hypothetical protein